MIEDGEGPWCVGKAWCHVCGYFWIAVWPEDAAALECPDCMSTTTDRSEIEVEL